MTGYKKTFFTAIGFAVAMLTSSASADLIFNLDYGSDNFTPTGLAAVSTADGATAADTWATTNGGFDAQDTLLGPNGSTSQIGSFVASATSGSGGPFGFGSDALLQDYVFVSDDGGATETVGGVTVGAFRRMTIFNSTGEVGGLDAAKTYDLYLFGHGDQADQSSNFLLTQTAETLNSQNSGRIFDGTLVEGENLTVFRNVSPVINGGFTEFEFFLYTTAGGPSSALNGLQLVEVNAVPEPTGLALIGMLAFGACSIRRKN